MTRLVEKLTITVTLNHDAVPGSTAYGGKVNFKDVLRAAWPTLLTYFGGQARGFAILERGIVDMTWVHSGLEEEVEPGDN